MRSGTLAGLVLFIATGSVLASDLPADVAAFVSDREQCDHFRGEEPYDEERQREVMAALKTYCTGTDARLKALKAKYRHGPSAVRSTLERFEQQVEIRSMRNRGRSTETAAPRAEGR